MRHLITLLAFAAISLSAVHASAQVVVVEEDQAGEQIVERGHVQGVGRGIQYGAHLTSPVYLTSMTNPDDSAPRIPMRNGPGAGVRLRIGWEFPSGLTFELFGGLAFNALDPEFDEVADRSHVLAQAEFGGGARYNFFNATAFVPFVQIGLAGRWFWFDWPGMAPDTVETVEAKGTVAFNVAVGFQIELTPYFGLEAGCLFDYTLGLDVFHDGLFSVTPFLGVTLYAYDENDS